MATAIIIIEIVQISTKSGSLDIDDFILNFVGALIGFIIFTRSPIRVLLKLRAW
jgi:glycopeptide antibiotics resistance protein